MEFISPQQNILETILNQPLLILIIISLVLLTLFLKILGRGARRGGKKDSQNVTDPKVQLECVRKVDFETTPLLNKEEYPVLILLEKTLREIGGNYRVMAQVNMGEIIKPSPRSGSDLDIDRARRSINSKRLDFVVIDGRGRTKVAIEYQGTGHHGNSSELRDAVKREALIKAGIYLVEIEPKYDTDTVSSETSDALINR